MANSYLDVFVDVSFNHIKNQIQMKARKPTYLSFGLGRENYAVSTTKVLEVLEPRFVTPVPNSNDFIEGVIAFRGNIVPVVNIRQRLKIPQLVKNDQYVIIIFDAILNNKNTIIAALTDKVNEVIPANNDEIFPIQEKSISFDPTFLLGMIKHKEEFTMIFDVDKVFELHE